MPGYPQQLFQRRFTDADQRRFADLSGDINPLHMSAIEARRTILGAPVVHGIHLLLASLEAVQARIARTSAAGRVSRSLNVRFPRPVLVGDTVEVRVVELDAQGCKIEGFVGPDAVLDLAVTFGDAPAADSSALPPPTPIEMEDPSFESLAAASGVLDIGLDDALARSMFPALMEHLGPAVVAELVALTRLVGMRCPGRHSVFGRTNVSLDGTGPLRPLRYRVQRTDERFLRVEIAVGGSRVNGTVAAFYRPPPQPQPSMPEVAVQIVPGEFSSSAALVVGGSRGLGEITAKIIAAGGGRTIVTYHTGADDAARVAREIGGTGGRCEVVQLDASNPTAVIRRLWSAAAAPRSVYYFATPKIFGRRRGFFSSSLLREFLDCYVDGFAALLDAALESGVEKLRVFYPSSVAVDEHLRDMTEYAIAKQAAERVCDHYNRYTGQVEIVIKRLPRIRTDQTLTIQAVPAEDALSAMLPIVREIETR